MTAIYHKALLRKDFSGVVIDKNAGKDGKGEGDGDGKDGKGDGKDKDTDKDKGEKKVDDPKAGADIGKIVNLMAGDANRVSFWDVDCMI